MHTDTTDDLDLEDLADRSFSCVFSDVLDKLGHRGQSMRIELPPLGPLSRPIVGWARPVRVRPVAQEPERPYGEEMDFIDSLGSGDVVVVAGHDTEAACWGELFSTCAGARGARGAVVDGLVRDSARIRTTNFPVMAAGRRPTDSLGRVSMMDPDMAVEIGGVKLQKGDLVVADEDGVVVVPRSLARQVSRLALEKASIELKSRLSILESRSLRQAWSDFGVL